MKNIAIKLALLAALGIVAYGVIHSGPEIQWSVRPLYDQAHPR